MTWGCVTSSRPFWSSLGLLWKSMESMEWTGRGHSHCPHLSPSSHQSPPTGGMSENVVGYSMLKRSLAVVLWECELVQLCGSSLAELLRSFLITFSKRPFSCATCPQLILRALKGTCRAAQKGSASSALSAYGILQKYIGFHLFGSDICFLSAITNFSD